MTTLTLTPTIDGNDAGPTILFLQGWPDDASLWDEAVAVLGKTHRCARITLPNYAGEKAVRWGYTTDEIIDAVVDVIRSLSAGPVSRPITLVLHDWGCYWGHAAHHRVPELVARVAGLDVSPHLTPRPAAVAGIMAYQWWLLGAFVLGGRVGDAMTRGFAKLAGAPRAAETDALMNYPYRNIWTDLLSGRANKMTKGYWPTCPIFFAYGTKKPFPFHSSRWVDHVRSVEGGEVVAIEAGHWIPKERTTIDALGRWLERTATLTPRATTAETHA